MGIARRALVATATGAAALGMTTATAAPALAQPDSSSAPATSSRYYYGSIALNTRTMAYGYSYDYSTLYGAKKASLYRCKKATYGTANDRYCVNVVWVERGCAAVAVKFDSRGNWVRYASAWATTKTWAIKKAHNALGAGGTKGTRVWVCTTR